jgi:endonuclease-8
MPEGDALHRAARNLQVLVGEKLDVETPHPRARLTGVADRLDGRKLVAVEAVGKNLLLRFEDGLVLRSHLRMKGRWQVLPRNGNSARRGMPWLVLRGAETEAVLWHGPVLELDESHVRRLGPDILADPPEIDAMVSNFRGADQRAPIGEALLDQRLVAGIGNMWRAEALWRAKLSPWRSATSRTTTCARS